MNQPSLELEGIGVVTPALYKCKECKFSERRECNTKVVWYCSKIRSNRTDNKLLKIKANNVACKLFLKDEL